MEEYRTPGHKSICGVVEGYKTPDHLVSLSPAILNNNNNNSNHPMGREGDEYDYFYYASENM